MTIPKKLKIGGHEFKILVKADFEKCGETNRTNNTIVIADWLSDSQKGSTLIHEIFHVLNNEVDHALLDSLSEQLYQLLSDNDLLK